jgi:hypothetical protein
MAGMKTQRTFQLLLAGIVLMLINACATYPRSGQAALTGTWTNSLGTVWTCRADGTFDVDLNRDGKRDAWGTVTVSGNTATVQRTGGINPKGCNGPGVYTFTRPDKDSLQFRLVSDACKLRKKNVLLAWHRK